MKSKIASSIFILAFAGCSGGNGQLPDKDANASIAEESPRALAAKKEKEENERFKEIFTKELGQLKPKWNDVEILESPKNSYRIAINYKESSNIRGYAEISDDTKSVARTALKTLVAMGHNPSQEWTTVFVHAYQPAGVGETGTPLTRKLGRSKYDFNSDQIVFTPPQ